MDAPQRYIGENRISFVELVTGIKDWILFLFSKWKMIFAGSILIAGINTLYHYVRRPVFTAETSFVLESSGSSALGGFSSLASLTGVNMGSLMGGGDLFQSDNILELYSSRKMLRETFLTSVLIHKKPQLIIHEYLRITGMRSKWEGTQWEDISFEPKDQLTIKHDSLLFEIIKDFKRRNFSVEKPSRQLSVISVKVHHKNERFAKIFNEALVANVNEFYLETKTRKSSENLSVLKFQTDSVKQELDSALFKLASIMEEQPNLNPAYRKKFLPMQKLQIDIESSGAVYKELVTNLEITRISHRNNTPLIQIIDEPILPLPSDKVKLLVAFILGAFTGGILLVLYFTANMYWHSLFKPLEK